MNIDLTDSFECIPTQFLLHRQKVQNGLYFAASAQQITSDHNQALLQAKQGTIVQLPGFLSEKIPSIPYQKIVLSGLESNQHILANGRF